MNEPNEHLPNSNRASRLSKEEVKARQAEWNARADREYYSNTTPESRAKQARQFRILGVVVAAVVIAGIVFGGM